MIFQLKLVIFLIFGFIFLSPSILYTISWLRNNFSLEYIKSNLNYDTDMSGFSNLPKINFEETDEFTGCVDAVFLGLADIYENCAERCRSTDYYYTYIDPKKSVVVNGKSLVGAYCLPKEIAKCNLNTSFAVVGLNGYKCISKFPILLGGSSGNEIVGCRNGRLRDGLENLIYQDHVPYNIYIDDVDEKLQDGSFRFSCDVDKDNIKLPETIASRFEYATNVCTLLDPDGKVDVKTGKCTCDNYLNNDPESICTRCTSGWGIDTNQHGSRYGYTVARDCFDPNNVTYLETRFVKVPCAPETLKRGLKCERGTLLITNSYTPQTMQNLYG